MYDALYGGADGGSDGGRGIVGETEFLVDIDLFKQAASGGFRNAFQQLDFRGALLDAGIFLFPMNLTFTGSTGANGSPGISGEKLY